VVERSSHHR